MTVRAWSFALQWARVGITAVLFLIATRFLTLAEIGAFATAFAPIRMTQGIHKAGVIESVIVLGKTQRRQDTLFALSLGSGVALSVLFALVGIATGSALLIALAAIPALNGLSAVSEGILRHRLALRALALRTIAAQSFGAAVALWMLSIGIGSWALAAFALINAVLSCTLSIWLAHWCPRSIPKTKYQSLIWLKTSQIAARDVLNSAQLPLAQLAIGLTLGLTAAGAFQIATRMLGLIDALTLSPLRFIALPQIKARASALHSHLTINTTLAAWVWGGTLAATADFVTLAAGPNHAGAVIPILRVLIGVGLLSALMMPITQALTAAGHTELVLKRAALSLGLSTALIAPALNLSATASAAALSIAALITTLWYLARALPALHLTMRDLAPLTFPLMASGTMCATLLLAPWLPLIAKITFGTALYAALIVLTRLPRQRIA